MYRIVKISFWSDTKIRKLTRDERSLLLYLFTNSHTHISGIYYLPVPFIAHEFRASTEGIMGMLKSLIGTDMIEFDYEEQVVWVKNMLRHQITNISPNVSKSTTNQLYSLHDTPLIKHFLDYYQRFKIEYDNYRPKLKKMKAKNPPMELEPENPAEKKKTEIIVWPAVLRDDEEFKICWDRWVSYRREIRKTLNNHTINAQLKMLSKNGKDAAMRMIEQSIRHGWHGLFELKDINQKSDLMSQAMSEWVQKKENT